MNSSSTNILSNVAPFEGFNTGCHAIMSSSNNDHHPMSYDDQMLRSSWPNVPVLDPMTPHFFQPANDVTMMPQNQIMLNSFPSVSALGPLNIKHQEQSDGGKKRKRNTEREIQRPKDVVHARAKRGQATDSHSLAERLRREKINDKLRCLQDLVPGCYKTMGMAVMLDVIINYVRSLQNQIDFLSMKLSAASLFYDFNSSEAEAMEALQGTISYEGGMEKVLGDGYGGISQFQPAAWNLRIYNSEFLIINGRNV